MKIVASVTPETQSEFKIFLTLCGCVPSGFNIFSREKYFYAKPFNNGPIVGDFLEKNCVFFRQAL